MPIGRRWCVLYICSLEALQEVFAPLRIQFLIEGARDVRQEFIARSKCSFFAGCLTHSAK